MAFLVLWLPFVFVWFVQKPQYPRAYRQLLTAWAVLWSLSAVLFLIVRPY